MTYIKMCRNALCEVIATYDLKDFEAEKKSIEEKRQELHTAISERKKSIESASYAESKRSGSRCRE